MGERFSLVTGGTKGIGAAIARHRLHQGDTVGVVASTPESLIKFYASVDDCDHARVFPFQADLGTLAGVQAVAKEFGTIPHEHLTVYANVGKYLNDDKFAQIAARDPALAESYTYLNARAGLDLLGMLMPARTVITGSTAAHWHYSGGTWYNTTKLAGELVGVRARQLGIDARIVSPGNTNTQVQDEFSNKPEDVMRDTDVGAVIGNIHNTSFFGVMLVPVLGGNIPANDNALAKRLRYTTIEQDEFVHSPLFDSHADALYVTLTQQRYRPLQQ